MTLFLCKQMPKINQPIINKQIKTYIANIQAGDIILTHCPFGLFSMIINFTDTLLYYGRCITAYLCKSFFNITVDVYKPIKIDHIARIGHVDYNQETITLYETIAINHRYKFFSFKRWKGGTVATTMPLLDIFKHYKHKQILIKHLKQPLTNNQIQIMLNDLNAQVVKTTQGLSKYSWKYVILSPFDIFLSCKKKPNKNSIEHINYCQMLIKKNNIIIGLEEDFNQHSEILESPLQEINKLFYKKDIIKLVK
jgi:hypothetical protein